MLTKYLIIKSYLIFHMGVLVLKVYLGNAPDVE